MDSMYQNGKYLKLNPGWHEQDAPWKAGKIFSILDRNGIDPSSVCEIGCGAGGVLKALSGYYSKKVSFVGFDISPQAIQLCDVHKASNVDYSCKDIVTYGSESYEVSLIIDVFEHVEDYLGFIRKVKKTAQYKVFHIPLELSVQKVLRSSPLIRSRQRVGHLHYFSKETALATLSYAGHEIVDYCYTNSLDLPNQQRLTKIFRGLIHLCFHMNRDLAVRIFGGYSLLVVTK